MSIFRVVLFDKSHTVRRSWKPNAASAFIEDTLIINGGDYYMSNNAGGRRRGHFIADLDFGQRGNRHAGSRGEPPVQ